MFFTHLPTFTRMFIVVVLFGSCLRIPCTAEGRAPVQRAVHAHTVAAGMGNEQVTNIPYYSLRDGMSSTLTLNNLAPSATTVTVTIFNTEGTSQMLPPITIERHSYKQVQLRDVLVGDDFDSGNIEIAYKGLPMAVTCQVSVFSVEKKLSFESREQDMMDFMSSELNGIVPLRSPDDKAFLAVTNTAMNQTVVTSRVESQEQTFTLNARETRLLELSGQVENRTGAGGVLVRLHHNGKPGDIITTGFVLDAQNGYSSGFALFDSSMMVSRTLAGVHFRFGHPDPNEGFPAGTYFRSPLLIANVGVKPTKVRLFIDYTNEDSGKQIAQHLLLKELMVVAGQIQMVELASELDRRGITGPVTDCGIDISYDAPPGSIIGQLTSADQTGNYAFEVPIKDAAAMNEQMEGDYPWTIENGNRAVVHFKNTTANTINALLVFTFPDGEVYNPPPITLHAFQSAPVDIQKLKDSKKRDFYGRPFPKNAALGQLQWRQVVPYSMIARLEETNVAQGIAKSFSCGAGCCNYYYENPLVSPTSFSGDVGARKTVTAWVAGHDCYNNPFSLPATPAYSTTNPSVATVDSAGTITLVAPGSATINAQFYLHDYWWDIDNKCHIEYYYQTVSIPVTVNPPKITNISPSTVMIGSNGTQITINGTGFGTSPTVNVPSGVTKTAQSGSDTQIVITVNIANSSNIGVNTISVTVGTQTSNSASLTVDGPYYLVVNSDIFTPNADGFGNGERDINYQVKNYSGSSVTGSIPIGETSGSDTGWNCTNHTAPTVKLTACGSGYSTQVGGTFTDGWGLSGFSFMPVSCGFSSDKSTWNWCDGATFTHELVVINGWIHTNAVNEFGVTNPPNQIPPGTSEPH